MKGIFGKRLKEARHMKGITTISLAKLLSVGNNTVSRWESGTREPDLETIGKIADILNTSVAYLMGETDDLTPPQASRVGTPGPELQSNARLIPRERLMWLSVISPEVKVCAGNGNDYGDAGLEWTVIEHIPIADGKLSALYSEDSLLAMYVEGDSMEPQIHDGDIVVFNHDSAWVPGNVMVVCLDGRLMVKGILRQGEGKPPLLRSANKDYADIQVNEDSFFLVYGRVLRIIRVSNPKPVI